MHKIYDNSSYFEKRNKFLKHTFHQFISLIFFAPFFLELREFLTVETVPGSFEPQHLLQFQAFQVQPTIHRVFIATTDDLVISQLIGLLTNLGHVWLIETLIMI